MNRATTPGNLTIAMQVPCDSVAYDAAVAEYCRLAHEGSCASPEELKAASDRLDQIETAYKANLRAQYEAAVIQSELNTEPAPTLGELGELRLASIEAKTELKRIAAILNAPSLGQDVTRQFLDAEYAYALAEMRYQNGKWRFRERDPAKAERPALIRLKARSYLELMQIASPLWLAPLLIPEGGLAVLYGKPKTGKTFFALELSICVATGRAFHGLNVKQGRVLYLAAEGGPARLRERVTTLLKARGIADHELTECDDNTFPEFSDQWLMVSNSIDLGDPKSVDELLRLNPGKFELVVIDTLARCMPSGDENATKDMNAAINGCDRIRERTGAAVLLLHHEGWKEKRPRGASALFGAVDALLRAELDKATKFITVGAEDLRDDQPGPPLSFMLRDGALAKVETETPSSASDGRGKMLSVLVRLCSEHGPVPTNQWRAACLADGLLSGKTDHLRRQQFRRAMDWMMKHEMIKMTLKGLVAPTAPADDFAGDE